MEKYYENVGKVIFGLGGTFLGLLIIGLLIFGACCAWEACIGKFSKIIENKKNRKAFMAWKHLKEGEEQKNQEELHG